MRQGTIFIGMGALVDKMGEGHKRHMRGRPRGLT